MKMYLLMVFLGHVGALYMIGALGGDGVKFVLVKANMFGNLCNGVELFGFFVFGQLGVKVSSY